MAFDLKCGSVTTTGGGIPSTITVGFVSLDCDVTGGGDWRGAERSSYDTCSESHTNLTPERLHDVRSSEAACAGALTPC